MKDSIVIDMKYADYDLIDGTPSVERIIYSAVRTVKKQMMMGWGCL